MSVRIKITDDQWHHLRELLFTADGNENAAFLLCGLSRDGLHMDVLVRKVVEMPLSGYVERLPVHLQVHPDVINSVVDLASTANSSIVMVHSHPSSQVARFSLSDDAGEARLMPVLSALLPGPHGSLVVSPSDWMGRMWIDGAQRSVDSVLIVGANVTELTHLGVESDAAQDVFDRQRRFWGVEGQNRIARLKVGIVGLGGTGSCVAEEMRRLGVQDFVLIDPDVLEPSNLSRMYGTFRGSGLGNSKVSIIADHLAVLLPVEPLIAAVEGSVADNNVLGLLRDRDVIMCCTDTLLSRAVLNRFAYQYLIPVVDMGVRIDARGGSLQGASGRVSLVVAGMSCLRCSGHLDPDVLREELMTDAEYKTLQAEGYVRGSSDPEPQVISLNSTVASLAVTAVLGQINNLYTPAVEQVYDVLSSTVFAARAVHAKECDICGADGLLGLGDALPASPTGQ